MTAVDLDALDKLRDRLAAALVHAAASTGSYRSDVLATALLPVVDRIANERAAVELEWAGEWADVHADNGGGQLRIRAAALREST